MERMQNTYYFTFEDGRVFWGGKIYQILKPNFLKPCQIRYIDRIIYWPTFETLFKCTPFDSVKFYKTLFVCDISHIFFAGKLHFKLQSVHKIELKNKLYENDICDIC